LSFRQTSTRSLVRFVGSEKTRSSQPEMFTWVDSGRGAVAVFADAFFLIRLQPELFLTILPSEE
jgi:hypothetical protein